MKFPDDQDHEYFGGSQAGGLAFSIVVDFCASLLKAPVYSRVCTQILLLPLTLCSRAVVFDPSWPLACNIKLVFLELCCDYLTVSP